MYTTSKPQYDLISGHEAPTPWWCYRITPLGYAWPTKHPDLDLAITHINKVGGEVAVIDPQENPSRGLPATEEAAII